MKYASSLATLSTLVAVASAQTQRIVTVSAFQYTPPSITADVGDTVTFVFSGTPGAHSVTQSNFAKPCAPLEGGFSSGFVTVAAGAKGPFEEYSLKVTNASQPIWFYCAQTQPTSHCLLGMVGAINAPTSGANTFENFQAAAKALSALPAQSPSLAPTGGTGISALGAVATGTDAAASSTAPANSAPPSTTTAPPSNNGTTSSGTGTSTGTSTSSTSSKSSAADLTTASNGLIGLFAAAILGVAL